MKETEIYFMFNKANMPRQSLSAAFDLHTEENEQKKK